MIAGQPIILRGEREREFALRTIYEMRIDPIHPMEVNIAPHKEKRSLRQNALMWKWIGEVADAISQSTGTDVDVIHAYFKQRFLSPHVTEIKGETVAIYTTTMLTKEQMSDYMDRIYVCATQDFELVLTVPEDRRAA